MSVLTADYKQTTLSLEALANTLESLYKHNQSLKTVPLVCQNDVLALESLVPGMISNKMPITSFTIDPTRTNLNITTESIGDQLRSVRDRIVKIFKDLWLKVVTWFNSTFRDSKKQSAQAKKDAKDAQDKTNAIEPIEEQVAKAVSESLSEKTGQRISPDEIITTLHEESVKVLEKHTSHNAFVVGRGQGFLSLLKNMEGVGQVIKDLSDKTALLSTAVNRGDTIQTELYNVTLDPLGKIIDPKSKDSGTTVEVLRALLKSVQDGGKPEFAEGELKDLKDKKVQQFLKSSGDLGNVVDNLQRVIDTESGMSSVTSAIDKLDSSVAKIGSGENASVVNAVVKEFRNVVSIVGMIYTIVKELHKDLCITASALNKAANGRYKALFSAINDLADKDDWLKQLATMKRSVGLESVDFEVEDSIFEGQDSELATDSHEVPEGKIDELSQAIDDSHKEIDDLATTQNTLEGMGIESFASTIKDVGKKFIEGIKKLIAKLKEWAKAVWAKITGKNSDVAKHAEEAKKAEKAEKVIEKPAEAFVEIVAKAAKEAEKTPAYQRTEDLDKLIAMAESLIPPEDKANGAKISSLKYEGLYDRLLAKRMDTMAFSIFIGSSETHKKSSSNAALGVISRIKEHSNNIKPVQDALEYILSTTPEERISDNGDALREFWAYAKKIQLFSDNGMATGLTDAPDLDILRTRIDEMRQVLRIDIKPIYDISDDTSTAVKTVSKLSSEAIIEIRDNAFATANELVSFDSKSLTTLIDGLSSVVNTYNTEVSNRGYKEAGKHQAYTFVINALVRYLTQLSNAYGKLQSVANECSKFFENMIRIQKHRIRRLKEAATIAGTFDQSLIPDLHRASQALYAAMQDPNITSLVY